MRIALGVSVLLLGVATASAAGARPVADRSIPAMAQTDHPSTKLSRGLGVRADLVTTSVRIDPFGDGDGALQHRFASSMIDYFPFSGDKVAGFRLSGGLRFYENAYFFRDAEQKTGGLLWAPRFSGGGNALRGGYSRYTPAATVGYTETIKNIVVGVDVGSLVGSATSMPSRSSGLSNAPRSGLNPVANVSFSLQF